MHASKGVFFFLPFILISAAVAGTAGSSTHASISLINATARANQSIQNATAYLRMVNQSGYLIFYPANLSEAYIYLNKAESAYPDSPALSVEYAGIAASIARSSYARIGYYKNASLIVMLLFTAAMGLLLYMRMKPVKAAGRGSAAARKGRSVERQRKSP